MLPNYVTIPAGAGGTNITVTPILDVDRTRETNETVVLQLMRRIDPVPLGGKGAAALYGIGWPSNAVVTIAESTVPPTNRPPSVRLVSPGDNTAFVAPANIQLVAQAQDIDGTVASLEFVAATSIATNSLGVVSNRVSNGRYRGYFSLMWTNIPVANYIVSAVATDDQGASSTSAPVHITVTATALPTVSILASDPLASIGPSGTNSASFVVRRSNGTNADLVVYYGISGTASNGVDYVKLPGSITIPAGQKTASISVDPLTNPNIQGKRQQTVILTVQAPPVVDQTPPSYVVGKSSQAVAMIVDQGSRRFISGWLDNGLFQAVVPVDQPATYRLETSSDLINWVPVGTSAVTQGNFQFLDPDAAGAPIRFYRTVRDSSDGSD
jgi:hypothetical protein